MLDKQSAFGQFFREHYTALHYFAQRMVEDEEVCRDIVSDALERAWANYETVGHEKLRTYTYSLVHNKCVDYVRHEQARARYADFCLRLYGGGCGDDGSGEAWEERERLLAHVHAVMEQMTPKTRYVLEQCYLQRRRYADVAAEMGISVSAVKKHIMSALRQLREEIAKKS